jgi:hypothetical protein
MTVPEQVLQKLTQLTEEEQKKVLNYAEALERTRGFDLRSWTLEHFTEAEFLAGMEEIKQGKGRELHEFLPDLERLVGDSEHTHS